MKPLLLLLTFLPFSYTQGNRECRPKVAAFLNCAREDSDEPKPAVDKDQIETRLEACFKDASCVKQKPAGDTYDPFKKDSNRIKINAAISKCVDETVRSGGNGMEKCMEEEEGFTGFKLHTPPDLSSPLSRFSYLPPQPLPTKFQSLHGHKPAKIHFHKYEDDMEAGFGLRSNCSEAEKSSLEACIQGVAGELDCPNPLNDYLADFKRKSSYCSSLTQCKEQHLEDEECQDELDEVRQSLCNCAERSASEVEEGELRSELLDCVEKEVGEETVRFVGLQSLERQLRGYTPRRVFNRYCPSGFHRLPNGMNNMLEQMQELMSELMPTGLGDPFNPPDSDLPFGPGFPSLEGMLGVLEAALPNYLRRGGKGRRGKGRGGRPSHRRSRGKRQAWRRHQNGVLKEMLGPCVNPGQPFFSSLHMSFD